MAHAEGNPITIEEVMVLMDGISVSGRRISDVNQVLRLEKGWLELLKLLEANEFALDKQTAVCLNEIVATDEAAIVGDFRAGQVSIAGVGYRPPHHSRLNDLFKNFLEDENSRNTTIERAVAYSPKHLETSFSMMATSARRN